jgi:hypothetical protein
MPEREPVSDRSAEIHDVHGEPADSELVEQLVCHLCEAVCYRLQRAGLNSIRQ